MGRVEGNGTAHEGALELDPLPPVTDRDDVAAGVKATPASDDGRPHDTSAADSVRQQLDREVAMEAQVLAALRTESSVEPSTTSPSNDSVEPGRGARQPGRRPWPRRRALTAAALVLFTVWAPMLITQTSWFAPQVIWSLYVGAAAVGLVGVRHLPRRGSLPLALTVLLIVVWASLYPVWSAWGPGGRLVVAEARSLTACAVICLAFILLTGPTQHGVATVRGVWLLVVTSLAVMGVIEVATGSHFSPAGEYGPPDFSPSGPFGNPNNLAAVLVVGVGAALSRMTERISRGYLAALSVLVVILSVLIVLTLSRSALMALVAVGACALVLVAVRRSERTSWWWLRWAAPLVVVGIVASFAIPSARRANPLLRLLLPGDAETVRSDSLRLSLVRIALSHWREQPWTGVGGGRFEVILQREHPEIGRVLPPHHTFVEILTEYGLLVFLPVVLLVVVTAWRAVRVPRRAPTSGRPTSLDIAGIRYLMVVFLIGFVLAGVVTSSSLRWSPWWLMLASMVVLAWRLGSARTNSAQVGGTDEQIPASVPRAVHAEDRLRGR